MSTSNDDPATWCGDRGPRIGSEGAMVCVLPIGHEGQHEGHASWRQYGWPNDRPVNRHPDLC